MAHSFAYITPKGRVRGRPAVFDGPSVRLILKAVLAVVEEQANRVRSSRRNGYRTFLD